MKFSGGPVAGRWMSGWAGIVQVDAVDTDIVAAYANSSVRAGDIVTAALAVNLYFGGASRKKTADAAPVSGQETVKSP